MITSALGRSVCRGVTGSHGGLILPRTGLLFFARPPGMTDSIGLSVDDYLLVPAAHRSIYYVDETTMRAAEDIITNIEASSELNNGGELVGSEAKGYAQYEDGTTEAILRKSYRYFGVDYPGLDMLDALEMLDTLEMRE